MTENSSGMYILQWLLMIILISFIPEIRGVAKILSHHPPAKCILQEMIFSKNSASLITTILFHQMNKIIYVTGKFQF